MKKRISILIATVAAAVLLASGCGGGRGAVSVVDPRDGEKLCVPKGLARAAASTASEIPEATTMQGSATYAGSVTGGDILVSYSDTPDADQVLEVLKVASPTAYSQVVYLVNQYELTATTTAGVDYFSAYGTGLRSSDCGEFIWFGYGSVNSSNQLTSDAALGFDDCGVYAGVLTGTKGTLSASGRLLLSYYNGMSLSGVSAITSTSPTALYVATWAAAEMNCARVGLGEEAAPSILTVSAGSRTDFDEMVFDLSCLAVAPMTYNDTPLSRWNMSISYNSATGDFTRSQSSSIGSISNSGVMTAAAVSSTATGAVWLEYGGLRDSITVVVSP